MALSKEQTEFYQTTLDMTRKQIGDLNSQIEEELAKVKERLAELQNAKNAAKQIYDGACKILGRRERPREGRGRAGGARAIVAWFRREHDAASRPTSRRAASPRGSTSSAAPARRSSTARRSSQNLSVCPKCSFHFRISARERLDPALRHALGGVRHRPRQHRPPRTSRTPSPTRRGSRTAQARPTPSTRSSPRWAPWAASPP